MLARPVDATDQFVDGAVILGQQFGLIAGQRGKSGGGAIRGDDRRLGFGRVAHRFGAGLPQAGQARAHIGHGLDLGAAHADFAEQDIGDDAKQRHQFDHQDPGQAHGRFKPGPQQHPDRNGQGDGVMQDHKGSGSTSRHESPARAELQFRVALPKSRRDRSARGP